MNSPRYETIMAKKYCIYKEIHKRLEVLEDLFIEKPVFCYMITLDHMWQSKSRKNATS